ncbi:signal recognition particle-docking protein FtsY [Devosia insulae DS-56]|uniref:Signal recognition particle receptor FtsY n=1 Tax=Devosia insulae DS-56 TaxID=1116389 RepID=A0A1E5XNC8_9HYPH|nr:signal recognition particle-docking protein FtsY [Devosia insulae]OEO30098.1 signal recognition particle-docking protein FtsY [Devosia insulae DS-56]
MAEQKKKGFFQRLFGGGDKPAPAPQPEPSVAEELEADIVLDEVVEAAPLVLPPDQEIALEEAMHEAGLLITPDAPPAPSAPPAEPEPSVEDELVADIILDDVVEAAPLVLPPDQEIALEAAMHEAGQLVTPEAPPAPPEPAAEPEPSVEDELIADIILDDIVEAAPLVLPPDQEIALEEALHEAGQSIEAPPTDSVSEPPAGPPEATPAYIEEVEEQQAPEPAPVLPVPTPVATPAAAGEPPKKQNWLQRLASGLKRSSDQLTGSIAAVFTKKKLDQAMLDDLEDILIQSDFGVDMATDVTEALRRDRFDRDISSDEVRDVLATEIVKVLEPVAQPLLIDAGTRPYVILMVGVNGTGKTTTIGKLASLYGAQGKKVMLAAGDTFRAAAIEQLQVWGERTGAPVITKPAGSDASGLAYEAVERAKAEGADILIIDTAGRLQNRDELMSELEKIIRVIKKVEPSAPHATLLTLDATTGQNALNQVEIFGKRAGVTGLVMTKLDGTARGGILVAIARKFALPVHFIGVGEGVDNLEAFAARDFAAAIARTAE